jgi:CarD family transcriptional regulator
MTPTTQPSTTTTRGRFGVGDRVVHPRHGAGQVVGRGARVVEGSARDYLEIELAAASLRISVPCDATVDVGLRPVACPATVREIVGVLQAPAEGPGRNYSARRKEYRTRLESGNVLALAAVIRDLAVRAAAAPLPTGERDLYHHSRRVLASELSYALELDAQDADAFIDEHIEARL